MMSQGYPSPEGDKSLRFDIYPPGIDQNSKNSPFIPENIFSGPKLHSLMYFPGFQAKQKNSYVKFFETSHFKKQLLLLPPPPHAGYNVNSRRHSDIIIPSMMIPSVL